MLVVTFVGRHQIDDKSALLDLSLANPHRGTSLCEMSAHFLGALGGLNADRKPGRGTVAPSGNDLRGDARRTCQPFLQSQQSLMRGSVPSIVVTLGKFRQRNLPTIASFDALKPRPIPCR